MNVILFGYRGCGKTTLGKKLAEQLWKDFVDLDDLTRQAFDGADVASIWAEHGEAAFRAAEVQATLDAIKRENHVIALGGGTLMQPDALAAVKAAEDAKRIYLSCQNDELLKRISADAGTTSGRPSLTGEGSATDAGLAEIQQVLAVRDPVYRDAADIVFNVTYCSIDDAVRHLITKL